MKKIITVLLLATALAINAQACSDSSGMGGKYSKTAVQCKGTTQKGARCKNMTTNANGYCHQHQNQVPK